MITRQDTVTSNGNYLLTTWQGGPGYFLAQGTWGGATATLQVSSNHGDWVAAGSSTTFTADGVGGFDWFKDGEVRVVISGATGTTNLKITLATRY